MNERVITREMRRQLERDNAKLPTSLQPIPCDQWPCVQGMTKKPYAVLRSRFFLVQMFQEADGVSRISVGRTEIEACSGRWKDGISWEELQDIKRQCGLGDYYAIEVYPKDLDTVNVANLRHLWVLREPLNIGWSRSLGAV